MNVLQHLSIRVSFALSTLVLAPGFAPGPVCLEGRCSIPLSYATGLVGANIQLPPYLP